MPQGNNDISAALRQNAKQPLDLSKPVQTRDGKPVRVICVNRDSGKKGYTDRPIIALVSEGEHGESVGLYDQYGRTAGGYDDQPSPYDLVNVPVKKSGWVNIGSKVRCNPGVVICSNVYETKEAADAANTAADRVTCIRIEWEEA